jgi:hypothetical protein
MHRAVTSTGTWSCMRGWHRQHETLNGVASWHGYIINLMTWRIFNCMDNDVTL